MGGRTAEGFTKSPVVCADPALPPIVGFARTAQDPRLLAGAEAGGGGPGAAHGVLRVCRERRGAQHRRHRGYRLAALHRRLLGRDAGGAAQGPRRCRHADERRSARPRHARCRLPGDRRVRRSQPRLRPCHRARRAGDRLRHGGAAERSYPRRPARGSRDPRRAHRKDARRDRHRAAQGSSQSLRAARAPGFTVEKLKAAWLEADAIK